MPSFTTECACCKRSFKTLYSLAKHVRERHQSEEYSLNPAFKDGDGNVTTLPRPRGNVDPKYQEGYRLWIGGLVERINSTFHPRLPGRWIKVDSHQVPKIYFEYFIGRLNIQVNAVRDVSHKSQPSYQGTTRKISYKTYDLDPFIEALEESDIDLNTEILFAGNKQCKANSSAVPLSAEEEILRANDRAYAPLQSNRPSSKSSLIVGYGEGRATREIEIIWWPGLYTYTKHGQLVVRMFIEKCEF